MIYHGHWFNDDDRDYDRNTGEQIIIIKFLLILELRIRKSRKPNAPCPVSVW